MTSHPVPLETVRVPRSHTPAAAGRLLAALPVVDLTIEDPPIERVIEDVFARPEHDQDQAQAEAGAGAEERRARA